MHCTIGARRVGKVLLYRHQHWSNALMHWKSSLLRISEELPCISFYNNLCDAKYPAAEDVGFELDQ